jgi:CRISPR system Cascade subunit CasE
LSETKPELTSFCEQFGYDNYEWESRPYDNFLEKIKNGDKLRFRITANPTKSEVSEKGSRGKVTALIITDEQKDWLMKKAEKNGFILTADSFDVMQKKQYRFYKKNSRTVTLTSVTFEGILTVSDADLVRNALEKGIGRGKAYGMGLLTVMRT